MLSPEPVLLAVRRGAFPAVQWPAGGGTRWPGRRCGSEPGPGAARPWPSRSRRRPSRCLASQQVFITSTVHQHALALPSQGLCNHNYADVGFRWCMQELEARELAVLELEALALEAQGRL